MLYFASRRSRFPPLDPVPLPPHSPPRPSQDHYDVKMPAHSLLVKLAAIEPATTLAALERIVAPMEKTLLVKVWAEVFTP